MKISGTYQEIESSNNSLRNFNITDLIQNYSKGPSLDGILLEIRYRPLLDQGFILQKRKLKPRTLHQQHPLCLLGVYTFPKGTKRSQKSLNKVFAFTERTKEGGTPIPFPIPELTLQETGLP